MISLGLAIEVFVLNLLQAYKGFKCQECDECFLRPDMTADFEQYIDGALPGWGVCPYECVVCKTKYTQGDLK